MFKRLAAPTGEIADSGSSRADDAPDRIVRSAILLHSGPDGKEMTLESSDGEISFDVQRIQSVIQNHNEMISKLALQYGGFDKMPIGAFPPILDQHADDSNDRIRGRVAGLLKFETRDVPKVGNNCACAVCDDMTFLGADTCAQVKDGRIYHLSVGIDENSDTLGEVSTVIEPAAPGAMVMKKGKAKPAKKNLKGEPKMSVKSLEKLKALKGELKQLSGKGKETKKMVQLAKRKTEVSGRFTKLMASKKMTPAEFKKLDITRLAKLQKEDFESVMSVYDSRESQIKSGQQGTTSATNFSDIGTKSAEDREVKRLKAAVKKNLKATGMKFKASDDDDEDHKDLEADEADKKAKLEAEEKEKKDLAEGDDDEGGVGAVGDDSATEQDGDMMKMVEENAAQIARIASMVDAIIDELHGEKDDKDGEDDEEDSTDEEEGAE